MQYVLLGAGLDTFALRNAYPAVRVFEVDHPATQEWKRSVLADAGIPVPAGLRFAGVDFHTDSLAATLEACGFDRNQRTVVSWLGVVPYLTDEGFSATMQFLASHRAPLTLVMDYGLPRHALPPVEQLMLDSLSSRVAQAGEPFRLFFLPEELRERMRQFGFEVLEDLTAEAINARYFHERADGLRVLGSGMRLLHVKKRS